MIGPASSSDEKSASAGIITRPGYFHSIDINPPSTGLVTVKVFDSENSSLSGKTCLLTATCAAGQNSIYINCHSPRICNRGVYVQMTGTSTYVVGFSLG